MNILVVGGGIFGCTSAIKLAEKGHKVTLMEREKDILSCASWINQYRLHRGYHYPRSGDTIAQSLEGAPLFEKEFPGAMMVSENKHYYSVAKDHSKVDAAHCEQMWTKYGIEHTKQKLDCMEESKIEANFLVKEHLFDPRVIYESCKERLKKNGVNVLLSTAASVSDFDNYDQIVLATYASNNSFLQGLGVTPIQAQYELCEKPIVRLPDMYRHTSVVVIDGPFMCLDPFADTGLHVLGNVVHAIHHTSIGYAPEVPRNYQDLLNKRIVSNPRITNIDKFISTGSEFFKDFNKLVHIGSMFTIRTVLANRDHDDARPTTVDRVTDKVISMFSGKIGTCVSAAESVVKEIEKVAQ